MRSMGSADKRWESALAPGYQPSRGGDGYGSSLTTGDFNDDGADDLAIGVPGENGGRAR